MFYIWGTDDINQEHGRLMVGNNPVSFDKNLMIVQDDASKVISEYYMALPLMKMLFRKRLPTGPTDVNIGPEKWINHFETVYSKKGTDTEDPQQSITYENKNTYIPSKETVTKAIGKLKNRKSPVQDGIPNELLKYGGEKLIDELVSKK